MSRPDLPRAYGILRNAKSGYTLVELAVTLAILLILSTLGIYFYFGALAHARDKVCQTKLKGLKTAVDIYILENDALPATLGHLKIEHIEKGYAKAREELGWLTTLSLMIIKLDESGNAYAEFLTYDNLKKYGASKQIFSCPIDGNGTPSYGINGNLADRNWSEIGSKELIIADSDMYVINSPDQLAFRHDHHSFAINKSGQLLRLRAGDKGAFISNASNDGAADDNAGDEDADEDADDDGDDDDANDDDGDDDDANDEDANDENANDDDANDDDGDDDDADNIIDTTNSDPTSGKTTICHNGKITMSKSGSALQAHLNHGDTLGPCPGK